MDIEAYIQSGIIESYVLGLASAEDKAEVETLLLQYVEVEQAIDDFSIMLENAALENAVEPPLHIKAAVMEAIKKEQADNVLSAEDGEADSSPVVHITFFRRWRLVAAASIILLIASAALNIYLYNKFNQKNAQYLSLLSDRNTLQANNQVYQTKLSEWQTVSEMMADSSIKVIKLKDPAKKTQYVATVFWNTKTKEVYVMANNLPEPLRAKQYQLWALVDGKPVDAGMLTPGCNGACKMKNIPKAQTFAITLEKSGGSPSPDLTALFVLGNV